MITIVKPGHELMTPAPAVAGLLRLVERAGRVCYKSEAKIGGGSAERFVKGIIKSGHESVIEHGNITVKIICDRSCSHQLVRHRIAAYSQESQRYCDYGDSDGGLRVICPPKIAKVHDGWYWRNDAGIWKYRAQLDFKGTGMAPPVYELFGSDEDDRDTAERFYQWLISISRSYDAYQELRASDVPPEDARSVLPNATKTEVVTTFNLRQWRHVFKERGLNKHAQWQIREIMLGILREFAEILPAVFGDLTQ